MSTTSISRRRNPAGHPLSLRLEQLENRYLLSADGLCGDIRGIVWNDANGDGALDATEPGLPGVTVYVDINRNGQFDRSEPNALTMRDDPTTRVNEAGTYWLRDVPVGEHQVREVVPRGSRQTFPGRQIQPVVVKKGETTTGVNFGNSFASPGEIRGTKWRDDNQNQERDPNEPGLPGVTIYLDSNFDGQLDPGEPSTVTLRDNPATAQNEAGTYSFGDLTNGQYLVREVVPDGFVQTFPRSLPIPAANGSGTTVVPEALNISSTSGEVHKQTVSYSFAPLCIRAFEVDVVASSPAIQLQNLSGVKTNGCGGDVSSFDISFTSDGTSQFFELQFVDAEFGGVLATIPVVLNASSEGGHLVTLESGEVVEGMDFGNQRILPGTIHGRKWRDQDGNGIRERGEPGLPGVTIYSDFNGNGELDEGEPSTITLRDNPATEADEAGLYWLSDLPPGDHLVREVVPEGFTQTFPRSFPSPTTDVFGTAITPGSINVSLADGEIHTQTVSYSFAPFCIRAFEVDVVASSPDTQFQNLTGVQTNGCGGDVSSFDINFTSNGTVQFFELQFVDDEFGGVLGTIPVAVNVSGEGGQIVNLGNGEVVEGVDFGNQEVLPGSIHGTKWQDQNENGTRERDEQGLPGVTIYADVNRNGALDEGEPRTLTLQDDPDTVVDETGQYWLTDLPPGEHVIREIVPDGFVQTYPTFPILADNGPGTTVVPQTINVDLIAGETHNRTVSYSFAPICVRAFDVDVVASSPDVQLQNLSGVQINGCGGDVSSFDIRFTSNGTVEFFDLEFVDAEFGGVLATIPVVINPTDDAGHRVQLDNGAVVQGVDFGNARVATGSVHGRKWRDDNGNGIRDSGEPGYAGVVIFSDLNGNGVFDTGEPATRSMADDPGTLDNEAGMYWFAGLGAGKHSIREIVPDSFVQTSPTSAHEITLESGERIDGLDFFNQPKFKPGDANQDGIVNFLDFLIVSEFFSASGSWTEGDFNGDGRITFADFLDLVGNFGASMNQVAIDAVFR